MATITEIQATDVVKDSRAVINTNFSNLNTDKAETSDLSAHESDTSTHGVAEIAGIEDIPVKATGAEITTGTDDAKFVTSKALADATVGKLGAAWKDWNPTFANFTKGSATIVAKYIQIGKLVHFRLNVTLAANSSMGTAPTYTLPITSVDYSATGTIPVAYGTVLDSGTATFRASSFWRTTTTADIDIVSASGTYASDLSVTATVPMTWTTNDGFYIQGTYEVA